MILFYIFVFSIPLIDSLIKYHIRENFTEGINYDTLLPFLKVTYLKNFGAALGIFPGKLYFLEIFSFLLMASLIYLIFFKKIKDKLFILSSAFVIGGGIGNLLDRIFLGFVTDYIQITFFKPVCNISDYFITLGVLMMAIYIFKSDQENVVTQQTNNF